MIIRVYQKIYNTIRDLFPHSDPLAWSRRLVEQLNHQRNGDRHQVFEEVHQLHPRDWHCGQCGLDTYLDRHLRCVLCSSNSVVPADAHRTVTEVEIPKAFAGISPRQERR